MSNRPSSVLSKDDWDQWARGPATEAFVWQLEETIRDTQERWALGHFRHETTEATLRATEGALVGVEMLRQMIDEIAAKKIHREVANEEGGAA